MKKQSLEEIIDKIRKNPSEYPETNRMARHRKHRLNRQLNKIFKGSGPLSRIPASEDTEEYPAVDESEDVSVPEESVDESELVESLVQSGLDRDEAEKLSAHYAGEKKPVDDTEKKYSDIFDILSKRYQKLQRSGQVGE